jgi:hypothetical protein
MSKKSKLALTILSSLLLLLVIVNIFVSLGNQSIQGELGERQQAISQTIHLETLNRQLINVLASLALKTNDEALKKVLAAGGINLPGESEPGPAKK